MISALRRKLWRDLVRLRGQVFTIALVIAAGIASFVTMRGNYTSLQHARSQFYERQRFAEVFAQVEYATLSVLADVQALPGVAQAEARIVKPVMLPLPQMSEPIRGSVISLPSVPQLNLIQLRDGRLPIPGRSDEVVLLQGFADAHRLRPGERIPVILNGRQRRLLVVGVASSPEYVMAVAAGSLATDPARFAVLWLGQDALSAAYHMNGACNDFSILLRPGASMAGTVDALDRLLQPYGGLGAYDREQQRSHRTIEGELLQLSNNAILLPTIFLAVAVILVNLVLSRLVALQQGEIATLKALGYRDGQVGQHYLEMVLVVSLLGSLLGLLLGKWTGSHMLALYARYFKFPDLTFQLDLGDAAVAAAISSCAAATGAISSVRRATRIPPAEAMRPAAPPRYRASLVDRLGWHRLVPPAAHMLLRELQRQPLRVLASCFALAAATALNVVDGYYYDGIEALVYSQFHERMREDVSVTFGSAVPTRALRGLGQLPGVLSVEGLRVVPMRIHANHRHRDAVIWGYSDRGQMRQPRNSEGQLIPLPPTGIVLTDILASILKVRVGDTIEVELREGRRERRQIVVTGFMSEPFGLAGHMRADALHAWLGESPRVSMALLRVDPQQAAIVDQRLKDLPSILEVNKVQSILQKWREQSGSMILTMAFVIALFAATITVGVVYNNARVALSMRGRDLATLRVLGFSRREVSMLLMGEQLIQVALSLPFGLLLGNLLVQLLASMTDPESYRIPVSLTPRSYVIGVIITLGSALLSGLLVLRLLNRLDLIAVLKARE